jgi:Fe-S-cluster containining protein
MLTPYDIFNMAKHLEIRPDEIIDKYCETYIGHTSHIPIVSFDFKPTFNSVVLRNPERTGTACPMLQNGKCIVHAAKPVVCALFPLGWLWNYETKKVEYKLQKNTCGERTENHTAGEWLGE